MAASSSSSKLLLVMAILAMAASWQQAIAYDPSPLQDFCVADMKSPERVNGFPCKDPMAVTPDDFFNAAKLDQPRNTKNKFGSIVTNVNVSQFPGLNTLGISLARIDYAHFQMNLDHEKPAAALSSLSSQNPGVITIASAVFGSKPPTSDDVLAKTFQVEKNLIDWLQSQFWENTNY
nr:unnamed protein product [Digitaria exilis]